MKKFFVNLVLLLNISVAGLFAQSSSIATLNHDGNVSVFYGAHAFREAHSAAVHGDAITLSSGTFVSVDITKNITTATNTGTAFGNIRFKNSIITQILVPNHTKIQKNIHISELYHKICLSLLKYKTV